MDYRQLFERAVAAHRAGLLSDAILYYRQALALNPAPEIYGNLGVALESLGHMDEALLAHKSAIAMNPQYAGGWNNLGKALTAARSADSLPAAVEALQKALALRADFPEALYNLGVALQASNQDEEAISAFERAVTLRPDFSVALAALGALYVQRRSADEAIAVLRQALAINPNDVQSCNNLGYVLINSRFELDEAIRLFKTALVARPDVSLTYCNLGDALKQAGDTHAAIEVYGSAPSDPLPASLRLFAIQLVPDYDPAQILHEHREWNRKYAQPLQPVTAEYANERQPDRRLRVGYVAAALRNHPVGRFMLPLIGNHDRKNVEVYCYCDDDTPPDEVGLELRRNVSVWRSTGGMTDADTARLIHNDRIDVLVDLVMHAGRHRLLAFARKPAPIQVTYLAYPGTTGLSSMDYRLTDPYLDPPGQPDEGRYSEHSVRLPRTFWCYPAPTEAPEVAPPPAIKSGWVTFGCLNTTQKVTTEALATWATILRRVPQSRLLLYCLHGAPRRRAAEEMARHGVDPSRLEMVGYQSLPEYFTTYNRIDVVLDTFPWAGGTTTCDALWMGVPVITLAGSTAVSRGGVSILNNVGLPELIAPDVDRYVDLAIGLAEDLPGLTSLRAGLRERMRSSPLMDGVTFARDVETAFRWMWRSWCGKTDAE